jgi:Flp pilus assembly protein TadD
MAQKRLLMTVFGITVLLAGCAATPAKVAGENSYTSLYDGEMGVVHNAASDEITAEEALVNAHQALLKGDTDQALFEYVRALELGNGDQDAKILAKIGDIHASSGHPFLAIQAYSMSLKLDPNHYDALEGLGLMQVRQHQYDQAKENLSAVINAEPGRWRAHDGLGILADLENDYVVAADHYRQALEIYPSSPQLYNNLGYSEYLSGNWDQALVSFHTALGHDRKFDSVWHNIGLVHARQGRYEDAERAYRRVMGRAEAYNNIGYLCLIQKDYKNAEIYLRQAIKLSPSYYVKANENLEQLAKLRNKRGR